MTDFSDNTNDFDNQQPDITPCPTNANDPVLDDRSQWEHYDSTTLRSVGNFVFHGDMEGFLENSEPSPDDPQQECFYDDNGDLIDQDHPFAGMGGTANHYSGLYDHTVNDPGGIYHQGGEALLTSMEYYYDDSIVEDIYEGTQDVAEEIQSWF